MRLTILTDNKVHKNNNLLAEHGLSFYIEDNGKKILFDTGYSDVFIKNAQKKGINLLDLDYIVFSHGHYDHTWGLQHYLSFYTSAKKQSLQVKTPIILTHPYTFQEKFEEGIGEIGIAISQEKLEKVFQVQLTKEPFNITENLTFLGEIPRITSFEGQKPISKVLQNETYQHDFVIEDSALAYKSGADLIVITGCSHSGICNITDYAAKINKTHKISAIIGGFHLLDTEKDGTTVDQTLEYLTKFEIKEIYPCHCTDFEAKIALTKNFNIKEVGAGFCYSVN